MRVIKYSTCNPRMLTPHTKRRPLDFIVIYYFILRIDVNQVESISDPTWTKGLNELLGLKDKTCRMVLHRQFAV